MKALLRHLCRNPLSLLGMLIMLLLVLTGLFAPVLAPYDPIGIAPAQRLQPPSRDHLLGTDELGRDVLSRIIMGSRISLEIGITIVFLSAFIGIMIGVLSGYFGGLVDHALMRLTDIFISLPTLILAIAMTAALGPSLPHAVLAMVMVWWPIYARLMRSEVLAIKEKEYIKAMQVMGANPFRIIVFHVLPNAMDSVTVRASIDFGNAIMFCASLSFIGLGAQPPTPEWGAMVTAGRDYLRDAWWLITFSGLAIFITVMGFNLLGDGIRDFLDPRIKGKR